VPKPLIPLELVTAVATLVLPHDVRGTKTARPAQQSEAQTPENGDKAGTHDAPPNSEGALAGRTPG